MQHQPHRPVSDIGTRIAGLALWAAGGLAIAGLSHIATLPPRHATTAAEFGLACLGFFGFSVGGALLTLGAQIFAPAAVSSRWWTNRAPRPADRATFLPLPTECEPSIPQRRAA